MQWVLRAQCSDREALELLLRSVQPSLRRYLSGLVGRHRRGRSPAGRHGHRHSQAGRTGRSAALSSVGVPHRQPRSVSPSQEAPPVGRTARRRLRSWTTCRRPRSVRQASCSGSSWRPKSISPASRAVLILHFQEELSLPEVAAILDIPLGTAKSRLAYGLAAVRKHVKKTGGSHG